VGSILICDSHTATRT